MMWTVIFGRHWYYLEYKEYRIETPYILKAILVYVYWSCWYSFSVFPVKYVKIYRTKDNVAYLGSYNASYLERKRGNRIRNK